MPYGKSEISPGHIQRHIVNDPDTKAFLETIEKREREELEIPEGRADVEASNWLPHNVVAIDGSNISLPWENGYPGAEIGLISVVSVLLKVSEMVAQDEIRRPMDPVVYRKLTPTDPMSAVVPGHNVMAKGTNDPRLAFRQRVYDLLDQRGILRDKESLLKTYEELLKRRVAAVGATGARDVKCPWGEACDAGPNDPPITMECGTYTCPCASKKAMFSTDILRLQESFTESGPSGRVFGETRMALEHLWLLNVIKTFVREKPDALKEMAFILDGTLKIDGTPSWLSTWIEEELKEINAGLVSAGGNGLCLVGIEKTGNFVEHFKRLDTTARGRGNALPNGWLLLLTSEYIRANIAPGIRPYYGTTYYGRKFFYKTKTGALICATVPFLDANSRNVMAPADPSQFARLPDVLNLLDKLVSDRYEDSLIPIIAAHAEASIPLQQGTRVLELLVREYAER